MQSITFIGGGNMAASLISGLQGAGWTGDTITVIDHNADKRERLAERYQVKTAEHAEAADLEADAVVLAVKPQGLAETVRGLAPLFKHARPLILSIAAGIPLSALRDWLAETGRALLREPARAARRSHSSARSSI